MSLRFPSSMLRFCLLLPLASLLLSGCISHSPIACPSAAPNRTARVFFATDRKKADPTPSAPGSLHFTGERTQPPALQMGWQEVQLGRKHKLGLLDPAVALAPAKIQKDTRDTAPARQALFQNDAEIRAYVGTTLRSVIRASKPPHGGRRQVLLFVHGFNDSFDFAVRKTGQFAGDLELVDCQGNSRGLAVTYSWPSAGAFLGYLADEETAEWTQQRMVPFLEALSAVAQQEGADLTIITHSMGVRVIVRSLAQIASSCGPHAGLLARNVILLAPDMSRSLFDEYFQRFLPLVGHLTIYVSSKDRALGLSSLLHGGHQRLGLLEGAVRTALNIGTLGTFGDSDHRDLGYAENVKGAGGKIDMIDVTGGLTDFVGHSYEDHEFIEDLRELIYKGTPAGTGSRAYLRAKQVRPDVFGLFGKQMHYFQLQTK